MKSRKKKHNGRKRGTLLALSAAALLAVCGLTGALRTTAAESGMAGFAGVGQEPIEAAAEIIAAETAEVSETIAGPSSMTALTASSVRRAPDETSENLGNLSPGDVVERISEKDGWSLILYEDGIGYVPTDVLEEQTRKKLLVAIDAGHQAHQNSDQEPVGPGSSETKMKVSSGTDGDYTGAHEYELNLEVALKLQEELEARGYEVLMVRTTNDVDISNVERAQMANEAEAAAFLRLHADGSDSHSTKGCMTICQTPGNPWNGDIYPECRELARTILEELVKSTGANNRGVYESDTYSGINWCTVPVTIVEMGFMSNEEEDRLMQTDEYQNLLVQGMANGLDVFLADQWDAIAETEADITEVPVIPSEETSADARNGSPETSAAESSPAAESGAPAAAGSEAPVTAESETPVTAESEAPVTAESEVPVTAGSEAPVIAESEVPAGTGNEVPASAEASSASGGGAAVPSDGQSSAAPQ